MSRIEESYKGNFLKLYGTVFDGTTIIACGREATKALIAAADKVEPEISHGNSDGFMDVEAMFRLKKHLDSI